jgi:hypothetical protein
VLPSLDCTNLKRTYESDHNGLSLLHQNVRITEGRPLDLSTGRNKIEGNLALSHTSGSIVCNSTDENIEKQLIGPCKKFLMATLSILDVIFYIYEGKYIDINHCEELEVQQLIGQIDGFVNYVRKSESIAPVRNLYFESAFARYLISFKHQVFFERSVVEEYYIQLYNELKSANIETLFSTLLFAVKESGSTSPTGVVICVLLMLSTLKTDNFSQYHRDYLVYLIAAHKCIVREKSKTNSHFQIKNIHNIKKRIYKKMCMILFPEIYRAKYEQIVNLIQNEYKQNYWFNEFSVILLMRYINGKHMNELDFVLRSLNNYDAKGPKKMNDSVLEYYKYIYILFYIEKIVLYKTKSAFVSCF